MVRNGGRPHYVTTCTPLRVSFAGGGTDMPDFADCDGGAVLSTAIDRHIYVTVKEHDPLFREGYRLSYSTTERVQNLDDIENDIIRESLRFLPVDPPLFISVIADLPTQSGLGSSSSFAVGLLNALHAYRGETASAGQLADEASHIEIDVLERPIGRQDHYAAAFGGFNFIQFLPDGRVNIEPLVAHDTELDRLFDRFAMFWTGIQRDAASVLTEQKANTDRNRKALCHLRDLAAELRSVVADGCDTESFGKLLDENWRIKRELASHITTPEIDEWYRRGIDAGAVGGKLCGAGAGGFLLFVVEPGKRDALRRGMGDLAEIAFGYESLGSRLLPN